jgi:hypothetical protein
MEGAEHSFFIERLEHLTDVLIARGVDEIDHEKARRLTDLFKQHGRRFQAASRTIDESWRVLLFGTELTGRHEIMKYMKKTQEV